MSEQHDAMAQLKFRCRLGGMLCIVENPHS